MINGLTLRDAFISASNIISNNRRQVDALNVFPVPDGDTGTNMSMTMNAAKRELVLMDNNCTVATVAQTTASALLRGARGNSGVILSLLFRGFALGFKDKKTANSSVLANALDIGVKAAYKAVMKPTEGTILTVARQSAEKAKAAMLNNPELDINELWNIIILAAKESLESTPDLLPVLKKAGVVDAGGMGLVLIFEGMAYTFAGNGIFPDLQLSQNTPIEDIPYEKNAAGEYEGEITFTYCTEFIVIKTIKETSSLALRAYLESIGDSSVVVDDDDIIKCHVHTDDPGMAMQKALEFGALTNIKIDNMREQHATNKKSSESKSTEFPYVLTNPERDFGFVAIAAGNGVKNLFLDLGVDNVVSGGQTMNPSTDDILAAIHATPAKNVIVLPNNKNIIMAAEQTIKLADRKVYVLPTKSIPQGITALLAFDHDLSLSENQLTMVKAIERVSTGQITFAARDSTFENHKIKKDEILALENGKLAFVEKDVNKALLRLIRTLTNKDSSFITVIYGEDISPEQANEAEELIRAKLPENIDLTMIQGDQPVYYYILCVE